MLLEQLGVEEELILIEDWKWLTSCLIGLGELFSTELGVEDLVEVLRHLGLFSEMSDHVDDFGVLLLGVGHLNHVVAVVADADGLECVFGLHLLQGVGVKRAGELVHVSVEVIDLLDRGQSWGAETLALGTHADVLFEEHEDVSLQLPLAEEVGDHIDFIVLDVLFQQRQELLLADLRGA